MNREIKFRAWDGKYMFNVGVLRLDEETPRGLDYYNFYDGYEGESSKILMQFTGLLDKNGKEIWESDICKTYQHGIGNLIQTVTFNDASFCLEHPLALTTELRGFKTDYIEVIGNIYEHSHLLDSK